MRTLPSFFEDQQKAVESLEASAADAYWTATLTGLKTDEDRAAGLSAELLTKYSSPDDFEFLRTQPVPTDHDLARQRLILIDSFASNQFSKAVIEEMTAREMEIESLFSNFRANLNGSPATENLLRSIYKTSTDVDERLAAWKASKQIGSAAEQKVIELVRLRNREAQRLGYSNYYSMQIELQELNEEELFVILESVGEKLRPAFTAFKSELDSELSVRFTVPKEDLRPWHYSDPFFQDAPESPNNTVDSYFEGRNLEDIASRFFSTIGFDIDPLLKISDLYEKPGKMQHAYCTSVGRGTHDVRVLCNLVSNSQWMATLLHEFGHAVYDDLIDESLPFFLRTVTHTMTTEAIAELMGRFVDHGKWLQKYIGVDEASAAYVSFQAAKTHHAHLLVFTQWVLVMANFERELYRNPDQDLDELWWRFVEKYQQLHRPDFLQKGVWASKIHLASSPVYYHNYLLGEMTASQILVAIKREAAPTDDDLISSPAVGKWLTEKIFRSGATYSWNELLEQATGEPLNPEHFVNELVN